MPGVGCFHTEVIFYFHLGQSPLGCDPRLGFDERIRGSHYIFTKEGVEEILNLQPKQAKAKAYQVKQVREMLLKYQLGG